MSEPPEHVERTLRDTIAPMVEADGGTLFRVPRADGALQLHLAGACAGCPGARTTITELIEPAMRAAGFRGPVDVTSGWTVPTGAERVRPPEQP